MSVAKDYYHLLAEFGKSDMDNKLNSNDDEYLVHCLSKTASNDQGLVPIIISTDNILPVDYLTPCNCLKYSRENVCAYRSLSIPCCEFGKCKGVGQCCNPHKIEEMLNNL